MLKKGLKLSEKNYHSLNCTHIACIMRPGAPQALHLRGMLRLGVLALYLFWVEILLTDGCSSTIAALRRATIRVLAVPFSGQNISD